MPNIKTVSALRAAFWEQCNSGLRLSYRKSYRQNDYSATVRCDWCDFVDRMAREGQITEALAQRATL